MGYIIVTLHRRDDSNKMPLGSPILYKHMRDMMQTWVLFEGRICTLECKYFCVKMKFPEESAFRMWYDAMIFLVHARHDGIFDVLYRGTNMVRHVFIPLQSIKNVFRICISCGQK